MKKEPKCRKTRGDGRRRRGSERKGQRIGYIGNALKERGRMVKRGE